MASFNQDGLTNLTITARLMSQSQLLSIWYFWSLYSQQITLHYKHTLPLFYCTHTHTTSRLLHVPICLSVCLSVPRLSAVSLPSLISSQLVPDFLFCSPQHKQAQWVIHTILKTVGATEKSNQPRPAWANYQCEIKSLRTGWLVIITTSEPNFICFCWVFFLQDRISSCYTIIRMSLLQ